MTASPLLAILGSQLLFTASDLLARHHMPRYGFTLSAFTTAWFLAYLLLRIPATIGQLYVLTNVSVGRTMTLFAAFSVILVNVLGVLLLKEAVSVWGYAAVLLALTAILIMAVKA